MAKSLLDQLKTAGLVDEKKIKQAKKQKHQQRKQQGKGKNAEPGTDESKLLAEKARQERIEHDRELNQQHKEAAEKKAIAAQVRQLIEMNRLSVDDGDIAYNFPDQGKVLKLHVSETIQQQLGRGRLAIVRLDEGYELVPAAVAEKIRQRDAACIVLCNESEPQKADEDDPYADYQIPDDLMW